MLIEAILIVPLLAIAYRVRGCGLPAGTQSGRVFWALAVAMAVGVSGGTFAQCLHSGIGALLGMFVSHGIVYFCKSERDTGPFFAVNFLRVSLITAPLVEYSLLICLAAAAAVTGAHWIFRNLQDRRKLADMLRWAEPVTGAIYGVVVLAAMQ